MFFFCESYTASTDKYTTYGKLLFRCGANSILSLVLSRACFAFLFSDFVNRKNSCYFLFFRKRKRLFKTFLRLITLRQVNQRYVDVVCAREKFCDTFEAKIKKFRKSAKVTLTKLIKIKVSITVYDKLLSIFFGIRCAFGS